MPSPGSPRGTEEADVRNALTTIVNLVNGDLDTANLDPAAGILASQLETNARPANLLGVYTPIHSTPVAYFTSANNGGADFIMGTNGTLFASGSAAVAFTPFWFPTSTPYAVGGMSPKYRVRAWAGCNGTNPVSGQVAVRVAPVTVSGAAGAFNVTIGTPLSMTATVTPAQNAMDEATSGAVDPPSNGSTGYVFVARTPNNLPVNVVFAVAARLERAWVAA